MTKVSPPCDGHIYQAISFCSNVAIFHLSNVFVEPSGYDCLPFSGGQTIVEIYGTLEGFPRCPGNIVHCFGWCHTMTPVILRILFGTNSQTSS